METKDIRIDQDLLMKAAKQVKCKSLADSYKQYMHTQFITYVEPVIYFLRWASEVETDDGIVSIPAKELAKLADTLLKTRTYDIP